MCTLTALGRDCHGLGCSGRVIGARHIDASAQRAARANNWQANNKGGFEGVIGLPTAKVCCRRTVLTSASMAVCVGWIRIHKNFDESY